VFKLIANGKIDLMSFETFLIKNNSFFSSPDAYNAHKITEQDRENNGQPIGDIYYPLVRDLIRCDAILAHGIRFDVNVLMNELILDHREDKLSNKYFCCENNITSCNIFIVLTSQHPSIYI
jgi:hypothetical protein